MDDGGFRVGVVDATNSDPPKEGEGFICLGPFETMYLAASNEPLVRQVSRENEIEIITQYHSAGFLIRSWGQAFQPGQAADSHDKGEISAGWKACRHANGAILRCSTNRLPRFCFDVATAANQRNELSYFVD